MAIDIDGFGVLRSIASHPSAFPDVTTDVGKAARTLVIKQIKSKTSNAKSLRDVRKALGAESFKLILDGMPDAQIKTLVNKLDKHHPDLKASNPPWRRDHLSALVEGSIEATTKAKTAPKKQTGKKAASKHTGAPEILDYSSAGATRKR